MRFRRIYWVTEKIDVGVAGVYTSVHDLIDSGLASGANGLRISLCELDSSNPPICIFDASQASTLRELLQPVINTGELTLEEVLRLGEALQK